MPDLISRQEALARGLKRYFTGVPCGNGHVSEKYILNKGCIECGRQWRMENSSRQKELKNRWKARYPEKVKEEKRRYRARHPEKVREEKKRYTARHPEYRREKKRRWRAKHPEKVREYRARRLEKAGKRASRWHLYKAKKDPEKLREKKRRYYAIHPEKKIELSRRSWKRKSLKTSAAFELVRRLGFVLGARADATKYERRMEKRKTAFKILKDIGMEVLI